MIVMNLGNLFTKIRHDYCLLFLIKFWKSIPARIRTSQSLLIIASNAVIEMTTHNTSLLSSALWADNLCVQSVMRFSRAARLPLPVVVPEYFWNIYRPMRSYVLNSVKRLEPITRLAGLCFDNSLWRIPVFFINLDPFLSIICYWSRRNCTRN